MFGKQFELIFLWVINRINTSHTDSVIYCTHQNQWMNILSCLYCCCYKCRINITHSIRTSDNANTWINRPISRVIKWHIDAHIRVIWYVMRLKLSYFACLSWLCTVIFRGFLNQIDRFFFIKMFHVYPYP